MFTRCGICCVLVIFERERSRLGSKISGYGQLGGSTVCFVISGLPREADANREESACRLGFISRQSASPSGCPLFSRKQTSEARAAVSALGQFRTHAPQRRASYSITSSARASKAGGTSSPSVLAVLRLMTISNFVGCTTGRSLGFSPLRMRPV